MVRRLVVAVVVLTLMAPATVTWGASFAQVEQEIAKLTADIDLSQQEILSLDSRLEATTKDIIRTYQKLDAQESALTQQKRALNIRVGEVYKNYDELLIGIFLDARSFTDIWKRLAFLVKLNQADNELLAANRLRLDQVRHLKQELARQKQDQIDLKRRKQMEYLQLQTALLQKKALLEAKLREAQAAQAAQQAPATYQSAAP